MKHFISANDVADIDALIDKALHYKQHPYVDHQLGANRRVGLLFMNPSMRTRISTQVAARNLGMHVIVFNTDKEGWQIELEEGAVMNGNTVEHIRDAAPVLGSYFDILCVRTFPALADRDTDYNEPLINALIRYSGVPVVSLESSTLHPLQSLADLITIRESFTKPRKPKVVLAWAPHIKPIPQCVANSFAQWVNAWGKAEFVISHPPGYELSDTYTRRATLEYDLNKAITDADFVYIKNWSSYSSYGQVLTGGADRMLTLEKLNVASEASVMHCLPVRRNVELSDEVLDSSRSIVTLQAANRVWAAQAVLSEILKANTK
jgi:N-succinyl-L-ornithine transcarbamylase